jgi:hypothetical protein
MALGPKSSDLLDRAKEIEPKNPRVWLISGMSAMFTPKMFGGGTDRAELDLRKAIALFETDPAGGAGAVVGPRDARIWLGQALQTEEKIDDARASLSEGAQRSSMSTSGCCGC